MANQTELLRYQTLVVDEIINESKSYPYTANDGVVHLAIVNDGAADLTVTVNGTHTIIVSTDTRTYSAMFDAINTVNASGTTPFQIELAKPRGF